MANKTGNFTGSPANISGKGFADMLFTTKAVNQQAFNSWTDSVKHGSRYLDLTAYHNLAKPGTISAPQYYSNVEGGLYNYTVMQYMGDM